MKVRVAVLAAIAFAVPAKAEAHVHGCATAKCDHRIHLKGRRHWARTHPWVYRWHHLSSGDRAWLHSTAECESHNHADTNTHNGFYGLTQFTKKTAFSAGFRTGVNYPRREARADLASWHEQAVRSVRWMHQAGTGQWPVCG